MARFAPNPNGFRHAELRDTVQTLGAFADEGYTASQMSYDLQQKHILHQQKADSFALIRYKDT